MSGHSWQNKVFPISIAISIVFLIVYVILGLLGITGNIRKNITKEIEFQEVLKYHESARKFWANSIHQANAGM